MILVLWFLKAGGTGKQGCRDPDEALAVNRRINGRGPVSRSTPRRLSMLGPRNLSARGAAGRTRPWEALPLDSYHQLEYLGERRSRLTKPVLVALIQDHVNQRIFPSVNFFLPLVLSQLHGIPEWPYPARARRSRESSTPTQANVQTSGYSEPKRAEDRAANELNATGLYS